MEQPAAVSLLRVQTLSPFLKNIVLAMAVPTELCCFSADARTGGVPTYSYIFGCSP